MRREAEAWWRQAQADLKSAQLLLDNQVFYAASWFVQQAVEKGLKALYIERTGTLARRTHDLLYLGSQVATPSILETDLAALNAAFETTRYPDPEQGVVPVDEVTAADAEQDFEAAKRVFQWIEQQLNRGSPQA